MTYHNTTNLSGPQLAKRRKKAASQEDIILDLFRCQPTRKMLPDDVWRAVGKTRGWPLTSVRARISELTKDGKLIMTTIKGDGMYGASVHYWRLKQEPRQLGLFG